MFLKIASIRDLTYGIIVDNLIDNRSVVQILDGVLEELDADGAQTPANATSSSTITLNNPVQTHVHRVEREEADVFLVVIDVLVVSRVHLIM